jgi:peptide/nickel transport system substrate-binding protein
MRWVFRVSIVFLALGLMFVGGYQDAWAQAVSTPRNETLYMNGIAWGAPANWNPLTGNMSFPMGVNEGRRCLFYEPLFLYNMLDGKLYPLLGTGYEFPDKYSLKVSLNPDAKWNDGQPFTADDVVYTFKLAQKYALLYSHIWNFLEDVVAADAHTVVFKLSQKNYNKLTVLNIFANTSMLPKHIWEKREAESGNDLAKLREYRDDKESVHTGAYKMYYFDDTKIVVVRDDNYWGQAKSMFGKLPAPKYIAHPIFKSNDAGNLAFKKAEVDMSQQFIPKVWNMWSDGSPIRCYLSELPYYLPASMPSIFFNLSKPGLNNVDVRRAIAYSIDYKKIGEVAMSGYTPDIVPALTLNTPTELALVNPAAYKDLQWSYNVDKANAILDKLGAKPGADGIRVLPDGTRLGPWKLECPYGWTDWNASLEIIAQGSKKIGVALVTEFPEAPVWTNHLQTGNFDIIMNTPAGGLSPAHPWERFRFVMYSVGVPPVGELAFWNQGRFKSDRADELITKIPGMDKQDEMVAAYTELNKIYLENIPSIPLMYRPWMFYTFNETYWKGYPVEGDGSNIPPMILIDNYGYHGLYKIEPTGKK